LTLQETLSLLVLTHELGSAERGIPFQEAARDAGLKFLSNVSGPLRSHLGELTSSIRARMEPKHPLKGARAHYERLQLGIAEKKKIRLRYQSLHEGREISTLVSPYALLYSRRSWYLVGRSSLHRAIRTFHLGRILESTTTADTFVRPPRFTLSKYLGLAWHLIRESNRSDVVIRFQPLVAANVAEVAWHPTQQTTKNVDGTLTFRVTVDGLREIAWWVLGYGDQAEVLEPPALRKIVAERARNMAAMYGVNGDAGAGSGGKSRGAGR
jgi:proteasome accessory factor B